MGKANRSDKDDTKIPLTAVTIDISTNNKSRTIKKIFNDDWDILAFEISRDSLSNKNLIDTATWYLGEAEWWDITASQAYTAERSSTVYNDNPTSITSNIGLMYPSDYGYSIGNSSVAVATGTGTSTSTAESSSSRTACLAYKLSGYGSRICKYNSWILGSTTNTDYYEWFLSPDSYDGYDSDSAAGLYGYGLVYTSNVDLAYAVRPVLYLKSTTKIVGGQGTSSNPYQLSA